MCSSFREGQGAETCDRAPAEKCIAARVVSARPLGPTSHIMAEPTPAASDAHPEIEIRVPGLGLPTIDSEIQIQIRPNHSFVFPLDNG